MNAKSKVCAGLRRGLSPIAASRSAGTTIKTVRKWMDADVDFCFRVIRASMEGELWHFDRIHQSHPQWRMSAKFLERHHWQRWRVSIEIDPKAMGKKGA